MAAPSTLRFENVPLPADRLLGEVNAGYAGSRLIIKESAITAGATTLGSAQTAFDMALEHAKTRVQSGAPLIEHANSGINKCVRDCMSFLHSDGAQDSHRLCIGGMFTEE